MSRLNALEDQLKDAKALIERRDTILRLSKNADFRKIILEDFFVEECARYARESGDPALTAEQRADALNIAQAAGHLKRYLNVQIQMANQAEGQLGALEDAIENERVLEQNPDADLDDVEDVE